MICAQFSKLTTFQWYFSLHFIFICNYKCFSGCYSIQDLTWHESPFWKLTWSLTRILSLKLRWGMRPRAVQKDHYSQTNEDETKSNTYSRFRRFEIRAILLRENCIGSHRCLKQIYFVAVIYSDIHTFTYIRDLHTLNASPLKCLFERKSCWAMWYKILNHTLIMPLYFERFGVTI